jgi:hypothetical protein
MLGASSVVIVLVCLGAAVTGIVVVQCPAATGAGATGESESERAAA